MEHFIGSRPFSLISRPLFEFLRPLLMRKTTLFQVQTWALYCFYFECLSIAGPYLPKGGCRIVSVHYEMYMYACMYLVMLYVETLVVILKLTVLKFCVALRPKYNSRSCNNYKIIVSQRKLIPKFQKRRTYPCHTFQECCCEQHWPLLVNK